MVVHNGGGSGEDGVGSAITAEEDNDTLAHHLIKFSHLYLLIVYVFYLFYIY